MGSKSNADSKTSSVQEDNKVTGGDNSYIFGHGSEIEFLSDEALEQALDFAKNSSDNISDSQDNFLNRALDYTLEQTAGFRESSENQSKEVLEFTKNQSNELFELADNNSKYIIDFASGQTENTIEAITGGLTAVLDFAGNQTEKGFQGISDAQSKAFEQNAINLTSQQTEGLQGFKDLLKASVGIGAIIGAVYLLRGKI